MTTGDAAEVMAPGRRVVSAGASIIAAGLLIVPLAVLAWLLGFPESEPDAGMSFRHFIIVANVSFLSLLLAVLVARSALERKAFRTLFLSLGFLSMAGFFVVHALATPGVLLPASEDYVVGGAYTYHEENGAASVLRISAFLSLLVPAGFFATAYLPFEWRSSKEFAKRSKLIVALLALVLVVYGALGLGFPDTVARLRLLEPPFPYAAAGASIALLLFSAWRQGQEFLRTRHPTQVAQVAAFLLLADAQVAMLVSAMWSLAWWEYHVLMLLAVVFALWALFIELDRRRGFERFVSPAVVDRIMSGDTIQLGGERRVVTILFADLRGSTALADKLPAEAVVGVLNSYVGAMAGCVFDAGGVLDKFLGDGLMAIFGVLPDPSHGAAAAIRTAWAIREALTQLNEERAAGGQPDIGFGVGIHTGEVVLGAVGLPQRSDYTAIGDTVNTASRLESLCKEYHVDSVLSADTARLVDQDAHRLRPLGTTSIRGKERPVEVFTIGAGGEPREV